jgi:4,4'-diaponeurosporenoate glycosyltransferase
MFWCRSAGLISLDLIIHSLFWLFGFLFLFRIYYCKGSNRQLGQAPDLSVIIPARNEEKTLPLLLESLNNQELQPEIIVVDDNSEDRTAKVAEDFGAMVVNPGKPPAGWRGKTWACFKGAETASGEILAFLDADTVIEKDGLNKIVDTYSASGAVISVQPYHRMKEIYEQLSAFFNIILMAAMGSFTILGNRVDSIGLFGPVMVISRKQYESAGGHGSVKGEVVEDLALGIALKKEGIPIRCYGGRNSVFFRMYPGGFRQMVEGWTKGLAMGASRTSIPVLLMIVAWIVGLVGTTRYVIQSAAAQDNVQMVLWLVLYFCFAAQVYWMLYRIGNFTFYIALFYPIPLTFFVLVFVYSILRIFLVKRVRWKGRDIDINGGENVP